MAVRKGFKTVLLKLLYRNKSITFHNVTCAPDGLYVEFSLDDSYEVEPWKEFQERPKAISAVVKAKWSCGELQKLAESVQEGKIKISRATELLEIIRRDARTARERVSMHLEQGPSGWF